MVLEEATEWEEKAEQMRRCVEVTEELRRAWRGRRPMGRRRRSKRKKRRRRRNRRRWK
jgi:hypothetical protein